MIYTICDRCTQKLLTSYFDPDDVNKLYFDWPNILPEFLKDIP